MNGPLPDARHALDGSLNGSREEDTCQSIPGLLMIIDDGRRNERRGTG